MSTTPLDPTYISEKAHRRALLLVSRAQSRIMGYFRRRRHEWLARDFAGCRTVIDIGGRETMWYTVPFSPQVTIVNPEPVAPLQPGFEYVAGDGRSLNFADRSFDLAFSNSVIA